MGYKTYKRKRLRTVLIGALVFLLLISFVGFSVQKISVVEKLKKSYEEKAKELTNIQKTKERLVYVSTHDIKAGEPVLSKDLSYEKGYSSMEKSLFATMKENSLVALVNIPKGTQILNSMVSEKEINSNIREEEFHIFYLSQNLTKSDAVDIRIFYPNGENYIVLSKKQIKQINQETFHCSLWLDEQETLLISSAIVDAYLLPGTYLYTTKYVESAIQKASVVTYTPKKETIDLIQNSPNILEVAKLELSEKLREALEVRTDEFIEKEEGKTELKEFPQFVNQGVFKNKTEDEMIEIEEEQGEEEIRYVD